MPLQLIYCLVFPEYHKVLKTLLPFLQVKFDKNNEQLTQYNCLMLHAMSFIYAYTQRSH